MERGGSVGPERVTVPERVVVRPIGTPLPLGFVGLAVATSVLACLNLGWVPTTEQHQVAFVLMAFAFPLQGLAAVLCFLARDAPTGAAIGVQAGAWLTVGLLLLTGPPGARSLTLSVMLFAAAAALLPSVASAALGKLVPAAVFAGTALRFVLTGLYERFGGTAWAHAAGWEGVALAGFALYAALASDLESTLRRTVLPMGRHGGGRRAFTQARLAEHQEDLEREPGARQQL